MRKGAWRLYLLCSRPMPDFFRWDCLAKACQQYRLGSGVSLLARKERGGKAWQGYSLQDRCDTASQSIVPSLPGFFLLDGDAHETKGKSVHAMNQVPASGSSAIADKRRKDTCFSSIFALVLSILQVQKHVGPSQAANAK